MNIPFVLIMFVGISFFAAFTVIMVINILRGIRSFQRAGGVQGVVDRVRQQVAVLPAAYRYPLVIPTWPSGTILTVGLVLFVLGMFFIVGGWMAQQRQIHEAQLLQAEGVVTRARVTDKSISEGEDSYTYYVHYTFAASPDGDRWVELQRKDKVPEQFYNRVEPGGELEVVYAHSNPEIVRIRALYVPGKVEYWWIVFLGGAGLLSWLLAWRMFVYYGHARRLDNEGETVTVRLLDCFKDEDSEGVAYYAAYKLPGVGPVRQAIDARTFARLRPGDPVRLIYLPDRPKTFRMVQIE